MRADVTEGEIDDLVGNLASDEKKGKRRKVTAASVQNAEPDLSPPSPMAGVEEAETAERQGKQITMEQFDALTRLVPDLPKPVDNVKTLGDLVAKYQIGSNPEFRLQVWRVWPRFFTGGGKADGFYDEYVEPLDESVIAREYGGGTYSVKVTGPHPGAPFGRKQYDSVKLEISGPPDENRKPRSSKDQHQGDPVVTVQAPQAPENPKLAEKALGVLQESMAQERQEKQRVEERAERGIEQARAALNPIVEAERRRADDVMNMERERSRAEREHMQEQLRLERERAEERMAQMKLQLDEIKAAREEQERRYREMDNTRPSFGEEFAKIIPHMRPPEQPRGAEIEIAKSVLDSQSEKHRAEIEALRSSNESMMQSLRQMHERDVAAMREAHAREMSAEREAWRHREQRYEDSIKMEREERRRDQEQARERADDRDRQWKDRLEQQEALLKSQWEARLSMMESNHAERVRWLQSENERTMRDMQELRSRAADAVDPSKQMQRYKELREAARETMGLTDVPPASAAPASGGIGLGGSGIDIGEMVQTGLEKLPDIINAMGEAWRSGQSAPPQQMPTVPGQVVQTPRGQMISVVAPDGTLKLAALADVMAAERAQAQQQGLLSAPRDERRQPQPQRRPLMGTPPQAEPRRRRPPGSEEADVEEVVPNMAEGLPKQVPPWKRRQAFGGQPEQHAPQRVEAPEATGQDRGGSRPQVSRPAQPPEQQQRRAPSMNAIEKQIAQNVAKLVHESVTTGDEPEEFVEKVIAAGYPAIVIKGLCDKSDEEILAGIAAVEPRSAGTTPAGHRFVREAMSILREVTKG